MNKKSIVIAVIVVVLLIFISGAIETNKPDAIKHMTELTNKEADVKIKVVSVKTKYPQGSEKHLIKAITGKE